MYKAYLVDQDIEVGRQILAALDKAHVPVTGFLWISVPSLEDMHLLIGTSLVDKKGPRTAFMEVWNVLSREALLDSAPLRRISLVRSDDPLLLNLRKAYANTLHEPEFRVTSAYFGDMSVEDAYIYRLAPLNGRK